MISIVALITPMTADASALDFVALDALIEWHIASGTDALLILGTTGESPTLSSSERAALIQHTVRHVRGRARNNREPAVMIPKLPSYKHKKPKT